MTETTEKKTLSLGGARKTTKVSATTAGGKTKAVEVKEKKQKQKKRLQKKLQLKLKQKLRLKNKLLKQQSKQKPRKNQQHQ